jgi:hypothetical protein
MKRVLLAAGVFLMATVAIPASAQSFSFGISSGDGYGRYGDDYYGGYGGGYAPGYGYGYPYLYQQRYYGNPYYYPRYGGYYTPGLSFGYNSWGHGGEWERRGWRHRWRDDADDD